jgi:hypothetical protein
MYSVIHDNHGEAVEDYPIPAGRPIADRSPELEEFNEASTGFDPKSAAPPRGTRLHRARTAPVTITHSSESTFSMRPE